MAKLCQDNAQVELRRSWGELKMLMNIALAAPESHPNLFKGYSGTAGAFIASLKGRQQGFCRRNYHIASIDECYWDRKKYIRPPSDAERAADLINATVQRRSR